MKPTPSQRRRGPRVALLALVLCSLLVPLAFIFDRAPSGTPLSASRPTPLVVAPARGSANAHASGGSGRPVPSDCAVLFRITNRLLLLF
jgi:alpha-1,4-galacturonosyltransferase